MLGVDERVPLRIIVRSDVPVEGKLPVARLLQHVEELVNEHKVKEGIAHHVPA